MRQTLFHIPHELFGMPVFGFGLMLMLWAGASLLLMAWLVRRQGFNGDTAGYLPVLLVVAAAIAFLAPMLEESIPREIVPSELVARMIAEGRAEADAKEIPFGLPIRGYGVMLMLATILAVSLAGYRARRMGLHAEVIFSLAFWMFIAGIMGARALFVAINWWSFSHEIGGQPRSIAGIATEVFSVTNGGLVVYGSVLAGLPAALFFLLRRKLPVLAIGDIIAPSMLLGLAIGRIGCLLNGCCYGGLCDESGRWGSLAVHFPKANPPINVYDSPPYQHQRALGQLHGIELGEDEAQRVIIKRIDPTGPAAESGLKEGDVVLRVNGSEVSSLEALLKSNLIYRADISVETAAGGPPAMWSIGELPDVSRGVHPTQIYSAINAALMCFFLWVYYPFRRRDGEVFALMLLIYPVARILLEIIRDDEPGWLGTPLTISQWVSGLLLLAGAAMWVYLSSRPRGSVMPLEAES